MSIIDISFSGPVVVSCLIGSCGAMFPCSPGDGTALYVSVSDICLESSRGMCVVDVEYGN